MGGSCVCVGGGLMKEQHYGNSRILWSFTVLLTGNFRVQHEINGLATFLLFNPNSLYFTNCRLQEHTLVCVL